MPRRSTPRRGPTYPADLFSFVASIAPARDRALDCATGNGQAAIGLAGHFREVVAVDASAEQIRQAVPRPNVSYRVAPAEATGLPDASFDAVSAACGLHWFDRDRYYPEVERLLRPRGVFAAWTYSRFTIDPAIDAFIRSSIQDVVFPYWAQANRLSWSGYRDVEFPFDEIAHPAFAIECDWTAEEMLGFLLTWSATRQCIRAIGSAFFESASRELIQRWGPAGTTRRVTLPIDMRVGRVTPAQP
jgi:SAM-dependent methyltransferase